MIQVTSLTQYLNEIGQYPRLEAGADLTADRETLINSNLRLVVTIAKTYARHSDELLDYIQDGNLGLIIAADRYDASRGPFANYAGYHIRNCITEGQIVMSRLVRLPRPAFKNYGRIIDLYAKGYTAEQIVETLDSRDLSVDIVKKTIAYGTTELPPEQASNDHLVEDAAEAHLIGKRMESELTEKQRKVVWHRFEGYKLSELGEIMGVSHQAVRSLEQNGLKKLAS
jgi:RNA polymerase sigma factor (sigma-70 family)